MNLELTKEQKDIQRAASEFAKGEFDEDLILELERNCEFPHKIFQKACKLGYTGIQYPEKFGGQGYGLLEKVLVIEEFCRRDSGVGIALSSANMGAELIMAFGDDRQKERYLTPIAKGKTASSLICPQIQEDGEWGESGMLVRESNGLYIVNGKAEYVLNGSLADIFIVCFSMNAEKRASERCFQFAILKKDTKGVRIIDMGGKLGMRMLPWNKLILEEVEISKESILENESKGIDQLAEIRKVIMVEIGAQALGLAQGAFDRALLYSKQREQFGHKIGKFQGIRQKLVDMHIKVQAARSFVYSVASHYDRKSLNLYDAMTAKLYAEEAAADVTDEAVQVFGGAGYMIESPVEHFYRDARMMRTLSGRQIPQKDHIADHIIGRIT